MSRSPTRRVTLTQTIEGAGAAVTVLDDRIDVEDRAIWRWLRAHEVHKGAHDHLVIGHEPLPPAWQARTLFLPMKEAAAVYLATVWKHPADVRAIGQIYKQAFPNEPTPVGEALLTAVSKALAAGKMWAIEAEDEPRSRFVSRTSPSAFAPLNPRFGTSIDFAMIAALEGDQWLRGYIPIRRGGVVFGRSGMTVASGFDVGQRSSAELRSLGLPPDLVAKLLPFANKPFKGYTKEVLAAAIAKIGPVPVLTKVEADLCDGAVFADILSDAKTAWDERPVPGRPTFVNMPSGWQTVWLSRFYQEGASTRVLLGQQFRRHALAGSWTEAIASLRAYTAYRDRIGIEATLLEKVMPPELPITTSRTSAK